MLAAVGWWADLVNDQTCATHTSRSARSPIAMAAVRAHRFDRWRCARGLISAQLELDRPQASPARRQPGETYPADAPTLPVEDWPLLNNCASAARPATPVWRNLLRVPRCMPAQQAAPISAVSCSPRSRRLLRWGCQAVSATCHAIDGPDGKPPAPGRLCVMPTIYVPP
jgi:hypothetical protein